MSQITLKPLDDGQKAVEIPLGKTTIGRGTLLGCSDKKVSRNHAVLEVTSKGEVYLTPTHVNPCFYQPTAESPGQILKKDIPHKLENGDSFSLLPRAYRYQLSVVGEEKTPADQTYSNFSLPVCDADLSENLINFDTDSVESLLIDQPHIKEEAEMQVLRSTPMADDLQTPSSDMLDVACMPVASTSKEQRGVNFLTTKTKRRRVNESVLNPLQVTNELLIKELTKEKNISQAFGKVLEQLLENISDSRKIDVMIRLLSILKEELKKENK